MLAKPIWSTIYSAAIKAGWRKPDDAYLQSEDASDYLYWLKHNCIKYLGKPYNALDINDILLNSALLHAKGIQYSGSDFVAEQDLLDKQFDDDGNLKPQQQLQDEYNEYELYYMNRVREDLERAMVAAADNLEHSLDPSKPLSKEAKKDILNNRAFQASKMRAEAEKKRQEAYDRIQKRVYPKPIDSDRQADKQREKASEKARTIAIKEKRKANQAPPKDDDIWSDLGL